MTAYTNHTILAEALEKWPLNFLNKVVPHLVPFIEELDRRAKAVKDDESVNIIDSNEQVYMSTWISIMDTPSMVWRSAYGNLKVIWSSSLFYDLYPEKFNNKTNGITFRRWLMHANPSLAHYLDELIGHGYHHDASELEQLLNFKDSKDFKDHLEEIKQHNKRKLR